MADTTALKNRIRAAIKANDNQEITGPVLQQTLLDIVDELSDRIIDEYAFIGIAVPTTIPPSDLTEYSRVFYLTAQNGIYTNLGGIEVSGEIVVIKYNGTSWLKDTVVAIDDEPTAGSNNLVKSGGIKNALIEGVSRNNYIGFCEGTLDKIEGTSNETPWMPYYMVKSKTYTIKRSFDVDSCTVTLQLKFTDDTIGTVNISNDATRVIAPNKDVKEIKFTIYGYQGSFSQLTWSVETKDLRTSISELEAGKQDKLTFDNIPTENSNNPVKSGGVKTALNSLNNQISDVYTKDSLIKEEHIGEYSELNAYVCITQNYPSASNYFFSNKTLGKSVVDYTMDLIPRPNAATIIRLCFAIPFETFDDLDFKVFRENCYFKDNLGLTYNTTDFYIAYNNPQDWGTGEGTTKVGINASKTIKEWINGTGVQESFRENLLAAKVVYIYVATGTSGNLSEGATKVTVHGELYKVFNGTVLATDATNELKDEIKAYIEGDTSIKYKLISLGDSLSAPLVWQNRVKHVIPNLIDEVSDISAGGTSSVPSSKQNGFFRVLRLVNDSLIQDDGEHTIVIMENVNDANSVPQNVDTSIANDTAVMPKDIIESEILNTEFTSANLDTIPQNKRTLGAFLQTLTIANGKKLTITNVPTIEGDITLRVGWDGGFTTVNVHVVPQSTEAATIEYIKEKILEYDYGAITDTDGGGSSVLFSLGNNSYETIVQFTDTDNTGMTCTIEAVSDAHGTVLKYFSGTSLSDWTDTTKWENAGALGLTSAYKGIIQYILTNFSKCHVIMAGFPRHSVTPSEYANVDGTYNVETWKQTEYEVKGDNLIAYQEKIAKLFNIPFVNIDKDVNITLSNMSTFYNNNNVHPKNVGYERFGDVMAANIKSLLI